MIGSIVMMFPLLVGGVVLKNCNDQYAKEKISSGYKVYINGIEIEGPVDIEKFEYTVDDVKKAIIITCDSSNGCACNNRGAYTCPNTSSVQKESTDYNVYIDNEKVADPILQKISEEYEVYINGTKVKIEEASKVDYDHVTYSVDDEKKIIIVTTR